VHIVFFRSLPCLSIVYELSELIKKNESKRMVWTYCFDTTMWVRYSICFWKFSSDVILYGITLCAHSLFRSVKHLFHCLWAISTNVIKWVKKNGHNIIFWHYHVGKVPYIFLKIEFWFHTYVITLSAHCLF